MITWTSPEGIVCSFDNENDKHEYRIGGKRVPGATTLVGQLDKSPQLIPWAVRCTVEHIARSIVVDQEGKVTVDGKPITAESANDLLRVAKAEAARVRDEAADVGHEVHAAIENFLKSKEAISVSDKAKPALDAFLTWYEKNNLEVIASEMIVWNISGNYGGTIDLIARINGKPFIADFKSGKGLYSEVVYQLALYRAAYHGMFPEDKTDYSLGALHIPALTGMMEWADLTEMGLDERAVAVAFNLSQIYHYNNEVKKIFKQRRY